MLICICCVIFITRLRVSFCIKLKKKIEKKEKKTMLKGEKAYKKLIQDCLKFFLLVFISLKMRGNLKNDQFLVEENINAVVQI